MHPMHPVVRGGIFALGVLAISALLAAHGIGSRSARTDFDPFAKLCVSNRQRDLRTAAYTRDDAAADRAAHPRGGLRVGSFLIGSTLAAEPTLAATPMPLAKRSVRPGCEYKDIDAAKFGEKPLQSPPEIRSANGVLKTDLHVRYTDPSTTSIAGCPVHLRTYDGQLVGPTLRAKPGDVLAI